MAKRFLRLDRRELLTGLGAVAAAPWLPSIAAAEPPLSLALQARTEELALRADGANTLVWSLTGPAPATGLRFRRGDTLQITLGNQLPVPIALNWHGIDGVPAIEPVLGRAALPPGGTDRLSLPLRHAGTYLCDLICDAGLPSTGQTRPATALALVVAENEAVAVDRDEVVQVQDWRLTADGTAVPPGVNSGNAQRLYTVNGKLSKDIEVRLNERLRFRFLNSCHRTVIAIKIEQFEVTVIALDGQPAEPFQARNGALVLAPGARIDALVDFNAAPSAAAAILLHDGKEARPIARLVASREPPMRETVLPSAAPLPSNGLPAHLDLRNALRVEMVLGGGSGDWLAAANFAANTAPAFRVTPGRTVVLALANRGPVANIFHLHGNHFRLLDRLDDGWKPFWLDTLAVETGQTQRVAFMAEHAGRWLIESVVADWAAPRLLRWYNVD